MGGGEEEPQRYLKRGEQRTSEESQDEIAGGFG